MTADMVFCRGKDQFIISLFLADLLHLCTAVFADRVFLFVLDLLDRQFTHPVIVCTLFLALMLRNSYGFFGGFADCPCSS